MAYVQGSTVTFEPKYPMQKFAGRLEYFERYVKYYIMFYQYRGFAMASAVIAIRFVADIPVLSIAAAAAAAYFWSYKEYPEYMSMKNARVITRVD